MSEYVKYIYILFRKKNDKSLCERRSAFKTMIRWNFCIQLYIKMSYLICGQCV